MKPTPHCILSLDVGTQGVRALLFDREGQLVAGHKQPIEPYFSEQPGWAEQDPELYWEALCACCRELWEAVSPDRVAAIALTTQRATVVNLDQAGQPLRPAITWLDQRQADVSQTPPGVQGLLFRTPVVGGMLNYFRAEAEANWIAQQQPDIWQKTAKFLLLSGYLSYRLVGCFVDSTASQVGYVPFDYKRCRWARRGDWKWVATGIRRSQLPELVKPAQLLGNLDVEAAQTMGLPAGLPVVAAGADKTCEVLGSGCLRPSQGAISFGTTATFNITTRRYLEPIPLLPAYPAALPDHHNAEVIIRRGFWMVEWFKREMAADRVDQAARQGVAAETLFEDFLDSTPAGNLGLMLQPFWSPGLVEPGLFAKGALIGFGDVHSRAHVYRAIIEGLCYALREGKERLEKRSKTPVTQLHVSGGGSQSDAVVQIAADVFGLPVRCCHTHETSGLGAAICAAVQIGWYGDFYSAVKGMSHTGRVFTPQKQAHQTYEQLYRRVYRKLYRQLKPLYQDIQQITGYPKL